MANLRFSLDEIKALAAAGETRGEIARLVGCSAFTLRAYLERGGIKLTRARRVNPNTDNQLERMVAMRRSGVTYRLIAKHFNVSHECVRSQLEKAGACEIERGARLCMVCQAVDVSPRGLQTMYCLGCARKAAARNGSREAYYAVSREVKAGRLPRAQDCMCVDCGQAAQHYDHRDYNKPLDVQPVCASCNKLRGPALPLGGVGLFTAKQAKFVTPNWHPTTQPR